jgi:hypothetical protein
MGDMTKLRHDLAHGLGKTTPAPAEQYYVAESAYWLFVMCLLRESRAPEAAFTHMTTSQVYGWARDRLHEIFVRAQ